MAVGVALVRHARSSHVHAGWGDRARLPAWREAYEAAGIAEGEWAPDALRALAGRADVVISSDAARAVATARLLARGQHIEVSSLFRELDLEGPNLGALPLPLPFWAVAVIRLRFLRLFHDYPSTAEASHVGNAAARIEELAARSGLVVVVTHASFRAQLALRLERAGWKAERGDRSSKHFSAWFFRRD